MSFQVISMCLTLGAYCLKNPHFPLQVSSLNTLECCRVLPCPPPSPSVRVSAEGRGTIVWWVGTGHCSWKLSAFKLLAGSPRSSSQLKSLVKHFIPPTMKLELLVIEFGFKIVPFIIFVGLACKPLCSHTSFITALFHKNAFSRWGLFLLWKTKKNQKKKNLSFYIRWKSFTVCYLFIPSEMEVKEHNFTPSGCPRTVIASFNSYMPNAFRDSWTVWPLCLGTKFPPTPRC